MINGKRVLSIITARKGSVGVPGKNFRMIAGRPLVQWSILHSTSCNLVDFTLVSSNCPQVKEATEKLQKEIDYAWREDIGRFYSFSEWPMGKFQFLQRPDEFATPTSKNEEALIHAYEHAKDVCGLDADIITNLQPTSPFRSLGLLQKCFEQFIQEEADSLFTASRHTPFYFTKTENGVEAKWDVQNRPMRQEIRDWLWHDDGNLYIMQRDLLLKTKCRLGGKMSMFELSPEEGFQIDSELDFQIIEMMMNKRSIENGTDR